MNVEQTLRQFVDETFLFGQGIEKVGSDDSLVDHGIIDSTGILELVNFIEQQFQIKLADAEIVPANLDSFSRLTSFIESKVRQNTQRVA
jgi:acyl carrier protein